MKIAVDELAVENSGRVCGQIFLHHDKTYFPARGWTDSVAIVLVWWLDAAQQLLDGSEEVEFLFMEGPHYILAQHSSSKVCNVEFRTRSRSGSRRIQRLQLSPQRLAAAIGKTAERALQLAKENGLRSRELRDLKKAWLRLASKAQ